MRKAYERFCYLIFFAAVIAVAWRLYEIIAYGHPTPCDFDTFIGFLLAWEWSGKMAKDEDC